MKIAAIISNDGNTVLPLVDGPFIRLRDTETGEEQELANPALTATSARRLMTVQTLLTNGVEVVVAPPATFCSHSYKVAKDNGIRFWNVPEGTSWAELWQVGGPLPELLSVDIPAENIAVGHHGHHHHHDH